MVAVQQLKIYDNRHFLRNPTLKRKNFLNEYFSYITKNMIYKENWKGFLLPEVGDEMRF